MDNCSYQEKIEFLKNLDRLDDYDSNSFKFFPSLFFQYFGPLKLLPLTKSAAWDGEVNIKSVFVILFSIKPFFSYFLLNLITFLEWI